MKEHGIKVNSEIYSENIVLQTIEVLSNRFYCSLDKDDSYFIIKISERNQTGLDQGRICDILFDHLNNQIIRERILDSTKDVRNIIIGKALFETEAFDNQSEYFNLGQYKDKDNFMLDIDKIAQ
jgi:His-Xaa-Ser system protein HxsD